MATPRPDPPASDPEVEGFLALLAARRAPKHRRGISPRPPRARRLARGPAVARDHRRPRALARGAARRGALPRDDRAPNRRRALVLPPPGLARHAHGQPGRRARAASPPPQAAADALAAEAERLVEAATGTTPRSLRDRGARRAPVRGGPAGQRGRRARPGRRRPRAAARPLHREGQQGAGRPDRPPGGRRAAPLPGSRPPVPRPPPPPRALPQRPGRAADPRRRLPHPAAARRARPASSPSASTPTCSATRSRPTCSKAEPTCAASRRCWVTPTSPRQSCTRTSPTAAAAMSTSAPSARAAPLRDGSTVYRTFARFWRAVATFEAVSRKSRSRPSSSASP